MKFRLLPAVLFAATLTACAANPGPPPVEDPAPGPETTTSGTAPTTTPPSRAEAVINVGVDPLPAGFNPHMQSDDSTLTRSLAALVLPSAFRSGEMDPDLLVSAGPVEPAPEAAGAAAATVAQTIRYVISPEAQWSDGTPITGADFRYLWQGMITTPGVIGSAGYREITAIRISADGRTVEVDFATPVADWQGLFRHLLPSHLLQGDAGDFAEAFINDLPASGGRYMVGNVDRSRGVVAINRNDRFWGADPVATDRVTFREIRSVTQGVEQLRTGQISFLDITPAETSVEAYSLMLDTQVRTLDQPRQLTLMMSTTSPLLAEHAVRAELHSLLDVPLIARLAAGRSADLNVPPHLPARSPEQGPPELLPGLTGEEGRPLRLGVDSADDTALAAARTIVDLLSHSGIVAEVTTTDLADLTGNLLPAGQVDAVIAWESSAGAPLELSGQWLCPPAPESPRAGNLAGYCTPETDGMARALLSGEVGAQEAQDFFAAENTREHVRVPLLGERRVLVLGEGIVGPDPDLDNWTAGISTVASWRKQ
ncbi:ABC transporter family substrate-binding protein [Corynebacterium hylobatis]|uniref:ABC transporter family substrate-binding protein n=1 Tax=Corynebacterium hylobatis TaxID=1859290 RepID=A0A430I1C8_9CORY|nr:ABC transporter family substrate-binding protein [Corynebacterium hylobatis]RSZ65492.1 ABC transporter family substrate-binding protein [Corynebacterium hylobatis]